jgi:cyclic beta-1,2-glucan synthetase
VLRTIVTVAPSDNVEIRRVSLTNHSGHTRVLALTSYAEIILTQQLVDQRHPAYNKLFIESEFLEKEQLLLFRRRPRSADEKPVYLAHFYTSNHEQIGLTGYETDRAKFLGRGGSSAPRVFSTQPNLHSSNSTGATPDMCLASGDHSFAVSIK